MATLLVDLRQKLVHQTGLDRLWPKGSAVGLRRLLLATPPRLPNLCNEFEIKIEEALEAGAVGLVRLPLRVKPRDGKKILLTVPDIRIIYKGARSSFGDAAGVIFQPLEIAGVDVSGWAVRIGNGRHCYLCRPRRSTLDHPLNRAPAFDASDEEVLRFLDGTMTDFFRRLIGGRRTPELY